MAWFQVADYYCSELAGYWTVRNFFWLCFPFASYEKTRVILIVARFLNQSQWPAKFTSYFMWTLPTFLWKYYPLEKLEFNDVHVLFKHSKFCSRMLEMHSEKPSFQNFSRGHAPKQNPPSNLHFQHSQVTAVAWVFSFSAYSKAFATYSTAQE